MNPFSKKLGTLVQAAKRHGPTNAIRLQQKASPAPVGVSGLGAVKNRLQQKTAAPVAMPPAAIAPPARGGTGGTMNAYADGGKVFSRKPNGKPC